MLLDLNASKAGIRTGYKHPDISRQLLKRPHVWEAIEAAKADRAERTLINANRVLERLAAMASADLRDILDDQGAPSVPRLGLTAWPPVLLRWTCRLMGA